MESRLKTIIVEDEPLAREGLASYIREVAYLELCDSCENALLAYEALKTHEPDLIFLDIQMPKLTGIDFLKTLSHAPLVIFTTAYPNYALQGFDLDVVDYLVKPYPFDRFLKAVNKARELHELKNGALANTPSKTFIFVKTDQKFEKINFSEILFVEGMENYVKIHTLKASYVTMMTLKNIEAILPTENFIRTHKSYLVAIPKINAIVGNELLIENTKIPISRQKRQEVLDRLMG
ncbi:LytR/AlgR family response regulator transcription factor [Pararhodonellum marinum]|uniref:LytR/AlgR family response regulator transcription factor n=1 Tax=Pararhodonellum marinum TaxID=2755358 RepID=UPI00188FCBDD|nr:LytTR family DNA-binding domain-containing protein [Pararhodonellum marinum]